MRLIAQGSADVNVRDYILVVCMAALHLSRNTCKAKQAWIMCMLSSPKVESLDGQLLKGLGQMRLHSCCLGATGVVALQKSSHTAKTGSAHVEIRRYCSVASFVKVVKALGL